MWVFGDITNMILDGGTSYKWDFAECEFLKNVESKKMYGIEDIMKLNNLGLLS